MLLIEKILRRFLGKTIYQKYVNNYIGKNATLLFFIQCFSVALVFVANYLLARIAGASSYGTYIYVFNLLYLLSIFSLPGLDALLLQRTAVYNNAKKYHEFKGVILYAIAVVVLSSILIATVFKSILHLSKNINISLTVGWFTFSLIGLMLLSLTTLSQVVLQGLKKIVWSQLGEKIIRPLMLLVGLAFFIFFEKRATQRNITETLIWVNVTAIGATAIIVFVKCAYVIIPKIKKIKPELHLRQWAIASVTFFIADLLYNFNSRISIFLLGAFHNSRDVGIFNVSLRVSEMIGFSLVIINFVISPVIATLFKNDKYTQLQEVITHSAKANTLVGSAVAIAIFFFSRPILLLFGVDFLGGREALIILCIAQLINVFFGSVGLLLLMTGYQRFSIYALAIATTLNIILNLLLIPKFGVNGAAFASALSLFTWNILMYIFVRQKLNIYTTALGIL